MKVRNKYVLSMAVVWGPFLLLMIGFHLLVLGPKMRRVKALEAELADARMILSRAMDAAKEENRMALREAVAQVDDRVSDFVLRPETAPDLGFEIGQLANRTGAESFNMKPRNRQRSAAVADCDQFGEERIDVSFRSRFHDFAALLNAVERHRPILFVETFVIDRPRTPSSKPQASMELAVLVEKPHDG